MCLRIVSKGKQIPIAENDTTCYKVLSTWRKPNTDIETLQSPIFPGLETWEIGKTTTVSSQNNGPTQLSPTTIHGGFLHSFKFFEDAVRFKGAANPDFGKTLHLYKCVIPKGTSYYAGYDDCFVIGYASKSLKILEEVSKTN